MSSLTQRISAPAPARCGPLLQELQAFLLSVILVSNSSRKRERFTSMPWVLGSLFDARRELSDSTFLLCFFLAVETWDEIGESDSDRDRMLLQLDQECVDVYRKFLENANKCKADLHQMLADAEAEAAQLVSALGERERASYILVGFSEKPKGTLQEQISTIKPHLEDLRRTKEARMKEFSEIHSQIVRISAEIAGDVSLSNASVQLDEKDLTVKKLGELKTHLYELQREKSVRLQKVDSHLSSIHDLSVVMSTDFFIVVNEVHPSLADPTHNQSKSMSNDTLARLGEAVNLLKQEKLQRLQKLQDLGGTLVELWNLMDIPMEEQKRFNHVACLMCVKADEVSEQGLLAMDVIEQTEAEVQRLNILKVSKMKELVFKKQKEVEEIYRGVHMDVDSEAARQILLSLIDSGTVDLSELLAGMDDQIKKAKEQALSRKDILDKVEKWMFASEEENWLDDYERLDLETCWYVALVENLIAKVKAWEKERGMPFLYHKGRLLETLEGYIVLRQEREEEKRRSREQKRLQGQVANEQEALFGSKPSPLKPLSMKKTSNTNSNSGGGTPASRSATTPSTRHGVSFGKDRKDGGKAAAAIPVNYVALAKDDSVSRNSSAILSP
ncbi:hypothetical protein ACLOJK_024758 [Asimina triloba]